MIQKTTTILLLLSLFCGSVFAQSGETVARAELFVKIGVAGNVLARADAVQDVHYDNLAAYIHIAYDVWVRNNSNIQSINAATAELDRLMSLVTYADGGGGDWPYRPAIQFDYRWFPAQLYNSLAPGVYAVLGCR